MEKVMKDLFKRRSVKIGIVGLLVLGLLLSPLNIEINSPPRDVSFPEVTIGQNQIVFIIGTGVEAAGVADYTCDGVDDNVQFQAALDALPAAGGQLVILTGTYSFSATVLRAIPDVSIVGLGDSSYITYDGGTAIFDAGAQTGWTFRTFRTDVGGVDVTGTDDYTLTNVTVGTTYQGRITRTSTLVVAANGSSESSKAQADYTGDGVADDVQIQAALDALPATGGRIVLMEGTYTLIATIIRAIDDVTFVGQGQSTLLNLDGGTTLIDAGVRDGWIIQNLATDAGWLDIATATNSAIVNCWDAGTLTSDPAGGGGSGGLYGINVEVLGAGKTLTPGTDEIYQYLDEGGANRIITLDTASATAGDRFVIRHNGDYDDTHYLQINQVAVSIERIYAGGIKEFLFNGTNWIMGEIGTGDFNDNRNNNIQIGYFARAYGIGLAIGKQAEAYNNGVALGNLTDAWDGGVAIGMQAEGDNFGLAVGYFAKTNAKIYSIAFGYRSETERVGETSININGSDSDQENNVVQGRWEGQLAGGVGATEIFCGGQANQRFTIRASSVLAFEMIIVARDNVANEVARYSVHDGLIKRDGANNTVMVNSTVVVDFEDDAGWDVAVTADDGNEALIITVTGDGANITQWAVVMNGVETHF